MMHPMFNSCCPNLLVNISTEYPELVGYAGIYHPNKNETTGRGGNIELCVYGIMQQKQDISQAINPGKNNSFTVNKLVKKVHQKQLCYSKNIQTILLHSVLPYTMILQTKKVN